MGLDKRRFYFEAQRKTATTKFFLSMRMSFSIFLYGNICWYFIVKCPLPSLLYADINTQIQQRSVEGKRGA
jgi:hypothetical protein